MKNELNNENKAKFFALHLGNELVICNPAKKDTYPFIQNERGLTLCGILDRSIIVNRIAEQKRDIFNQTALLLKPLSLMSDEDAMEVWIQVHRDKGSFNIGMQEFKSQLDALALSNWNSYKVYDYLRSKGYALHWMGLTVEEMVSAGWIKLSN